MTGTRFAPTPSGYLHSGNLVNLVLCAAVSRELSIPLALRIDDSDQDRVRVRYVNDIFRVLAWLDISPDAGPMDSNELITTYSQRLRLADYWSALEHLDRSAELFCCTCSRSALQDGRCVHGCSAPLVAYRPGSTRVRWRTTQGDVVLWGHHGQDPAYHLVTVVEDHRLTTSHIVRGQDLQSSTALHQQLAALLYPQDVIQYAHHELIMDAVGMKLSKSQGPDQLALTDALRRDIDTHAASLLPLVLTQLTG